VEGWWRGGGLRLRLHLELQALRILSDGYLFLDEGDDPQGTGTLRQSSRSTSWIFFSSRA